MLRYKVICLSAIPIRWIIWNLTGGVNGGLHITDVTNASQNHADGSLNPELG